MRVENKKISRIRRFYHGTGLYHERIDLALCGGEYKDFGNGYYLTSLWHQAASWAIRRGRHGGGWVFEYELQPLPNDIRILELLLYNQEWLDYIVNHRKYGIQDEWDIVYDRMADSQYRDLLSAIDDYAMKRISSGEVLDKIMFRSTRRDQYCFKTQRAISLLKRTHTYYYSYDGKWYERVRGENNE